MDREKVKIGLQCIVDGTVRCASCGYSIDKHGRYGCHQDCAIDALALLKEQEEQIKNYDESLEKAREEIKWLWEMMKK